MFNLSRLRFDPQGRINASTNAFLIIDDPNSQTIWWIESEISFFFIELKFKKTYLCFVTIWLLSSQVWIMFDKKPLIADLLAQILNKCEL